MSLFTFICLARNQAAGQIDIQDLPEGGYRRHALSLLREHASAETIEVWRDDEVLEVIDRADAAVWPPTRDPGKSV